MKSENEADVIVIGAGIAGVAAAVALRDRFLDAIVLEARSDRIGGRIWSKKVWDGTVVDLGASWMTHETINPIADFVAEQGIKTVSSELLNLTLSEANGPVLGTDDVAEALAVYLDVYAEVKQNAAMQNAAGRRDRPGSEEFKCVIDGRQLSAETRRRLEFFINYTVTEPNASPLEDLSLYHWDDDFIFVQLAMSVFPNGYAEVVERMAEGLDIRMDQVVSQIAYDDDGVTVTTQHGEFRAPQAIVALPHAVLRDPDAVTFCPPLPPRKRAAIDRIHTGLSDKFWFRFPEVFWHPKPDGVSPAEEPDAVHRIDATMKGEWSTWINFHKYHHIPMLMCFNRNDHARKLETMSDDAVIREVLPLLRAQWGVDVPAPLLARSKWGADPFALGTLPHVPPGASGNDYRLIGRRVGPLGFCGDSTSEEFPGMSMGAYLSGLRAARSVPLWGRVPV